MDMDGFRRDVMKSTLFEVAETSVDAYADLFDSEMARLLDIHAPLRVKTKRCGKNDCRWSSEEAREAKRHRRRLERRYRRTNNEADRRAYKAACVAACDSINKSRADDIRSSLEEAAGDQRATWRTAHKLLHSKPPVYHSDVDSEKLANEFSQFFADKVSRICDAITAAVKLLPVRTFPVRQHAGTGFSEFAHVTDEDVQRILRKMPSKSSPLDVIPCSLLKSCADIFASIIARLANLSFVEGRFPSRYKSALVRPLLKKPGLDRTTTANYRPISNLSTVSKILERLSQTQLRPHLIGSSNFNAFQSGYRAGHSTETALLEVMDGLYTAADNKQFTVLIGLDISAAFDTISHSRLLDRLQTEFGVTGPALSWIRSYLEDRTQFVRVGRHSSPVVRCTSGVPQGSVLGPLLFTVYTSPVGDVINSHGVRFHQYADDTQLHLAMKVDTSDAGIAILAACTSDVKYWYMTNGLQWGTGSVDTRNDTVPKEPCNSVIRSDSD